MSSPGRLYLERLGIRSEVRSFFEPYLNQTCGEIIFKYGHSAEHVNHDFHFIPTTEVLWTAGNFDLAGHIFICGSAMDALSFLHLHYHVYHTHLFFAAVGTSPSPAQLEPLIHPKKQYHLVFSKDELGAICDLKAASYIRKSPIKIIANENCFNLTFRSKNYPVKNLSLHALEKAAGFHFNIPVSKPKKHNTFYEQLKYGHPG